MRMINSDGQVVNAKVLARDSGTANRNDNSIVIDTGKHAATLALCAILCGLCAAVSWWAVEAQHDIAVRYRDDSLNTQEEFQKVRNHVIELEARTKVNADEIAALKQELAHVR